MLVNRMFAVTVGARRRLAYPLRKSDPVHARAEFLRDFRVALAARLWEVFSIYQRPLVAPLLHFMASMTIDAVGSFLVTPKQG